MSEWNSKASKWFEKVFFFTFESSLSPPYGQCYVLLCSLYIFCFVFFSYSYHTHLLMSQ